MNEQRYEFLSEIDLDLQGLSEDSLIFQWKLWLEQVRASIALDEERNNFGLFESEDTLF